MTKKRSPILPIVLSVAIGLLVIILLTNVLNPVPVVVATGPIAPGTILIPDLVEVKTVPAQARPANAFTSIEEVTGKMVSVGRSNGDFITQDTLGEISTSGIPSQLESGHVAMAINIDQATGIGGILRPGQQVSVIGMISPEVLQYSQYQNSNLQISIPSTPFPDDDALPILPTMTPTASPPQAVVSKLLITGLKVLMVPQSFRYEELPASSSEEALFANARMASSNQSESILILDVPAKSIEIWSGYLISPAALLAALNHYGEIHLVLDSADGLDLEGEDFITLNLADFYQQMNQERWIAPTETLEPVLTEEADTTDELLATMTVAATETPEMTTEDD